MDANVMLNETGNIRLYFAMQKGFSGQNWLYVIWVCYLVCLINK